MTKDLKSTVPTALNKTAVSYSKLLLVLATIGIYAILAVVVGNVFTRLLFNTPIPASFEISRLLMPVVVFGGLAWTFANVGHFRMDLLRELIPSKSGHWIDRAQILVYIIIFALLAWVTSVDAIGSVAKAEFEPGAIQVPIYPIRVFIALGCIAIPLVLISRLFAKKPEDVLPDGNSDLLEEDDMGEPDGVALDTKAGK